MTKTSVSVFWFSFTEPGGLLFLTFWSGGTLGLLVFACVNGILTDIHLLCSQARAEPPTQSQIHLHDHLHAAGNRVSPETQQRGAVITKLFVLFRCCVFHCASSAYWRSSFCLSFPVFCPSPPPSRLRPALLPPRPLVCPLQVCKQIWLGLYDDRTLVVPDFREPQKVKEFLQEKYEKKRW